MLLPLVVACGLIVSGPQATQSKPLLRAALVSDTHMMAHGEPDQETYLAHYRSVISAVNAAKPDVVIITGDLTQGGLPEEILAFQTETRMFRAPVLLVPGNHDVGGKKELGAKEAATTQRIAQYEKAFGRSFYAKNVRGVRLIGLNAFLIGSGMPDENAQWAFLDKELQRAKGKPVVLFLHTPLYAEKPDEPGGAYFNIEPEPRKRLLDMIERYKVRAVLSGHLHHELALTYGGTLLYSTPPVAFGLPAGKQPEGWTLVTVPREGPVQAEFRSIPSAK